MWFSAQFAEFSTLILATFKASVLTQSQPQLTSHQFNPYYQPQSRRFKPTSYHRFWSLPHTPQHQCFCFLRWSVYGAGGVAPLTSNRTGVLQCLLHSATLPYTAPYPAKMSYHTAGGYRNGPHVVKWQPMPGGSCNKKQCCLAFLQPSRGNRVRR